MKIPFKLSLIVPILALLTLQSCSDECTETIQYISYEPVIANLDSLRGTFEILDAQPMEQPGKIYFYNGYLFISELKKGVHIIDNRDPSNPQPTKFIKVLGNQDMAVKGNRLYLDNYLDLLTVDISNPTQPSLTSRTEAVFKNIYAYWDEGIVIDYTEELITQVVDCTETNQWDCFNCEIDFISADALSNTTGANATAVPVSGSPGIGGSFARFTINDDHLYTVDEWDISTFDISNLDQPAYQGVTNIGWGIETIFPYNDNLFIGSNSGMFIYDLTDPSAPNLRSEFRHARACDPVFVYRDTAYITLRDGSLCEGFVNQLDVVDVKDIDHPFLIRSQEMTHPHGLSVTEESIYLCEGTHGINVLDRSNIISGQGQLILSSFPDLHAYDIIALSSDVAMVIGDDGLYQFDVSNPTFIQELSRIPVNR